MSVDRIFKLTDLKPQLLLQPRGTKVYLSEKLSDVIEQAILKKKPSGGCLSLINGAEYYVSDLHHDSDAAKIFSEIEAESNCKIVYNDNEHLWYGYVVLQEKREKKELKSVDTISTLAELKTALISKPPGTKAYLAHDLRDKFEQSILVQTRLRRYSTAEFKPESDVAKLLQEIKAENKCEIAYDDNFHMFYAYVQLQEKEELKSIEVESVPLSSSIPQVRDNMINGLIVHVNHMKNTIEKLQQDFDQVLLGLNALRS